MSTTKTKKKRHPLRKLFLLGTVVGIAAAVKNAIADKGGSYEAPAAPAPKPAAAPRPAAAPAPVAAEPVAEPAPVDEPTAEVAEAAEPDAELVADEPAAEVADEPAPFPAPPATRVQTAEEVLESEPAKDRVNLADPEDAPKEATKKIDPFGPQ